MDLSFIVWNTYKYCDLYTINNIKNLGKSYYDIVLDELHQRIIVFFKNNWLNLSNKINLKTSFDFIKKFQDKLDWDSINKHRLSKLDIKYIREFRDRINWQFICSWRYENRLTEDFIDEFSDELDWNYLSGNRFTKRLSQELIRKNKDKVIWKDISKYQILDRAFILEFKDLLNWDLIISHQKIDERLLIEFENRLNWDLVSKLKFTQVKFSSDFIIKYQDFHNLQVQKHQKLYKILQNC